MKYTEYLLILAQLAFASTASNISSEYEYVVVGSGAGGGTVAASLARKGHSVFLIEAGGDHGAELEQVVPAQTFTAEEDAKMAWTFYINHYRNQTQGRRDSKYVYRLTDGTLYYGLEPPSRAKPLGTLYPRGATLGGSTQINALNWGAPSDNDWNWLANYTSDQSWSAEVMNPYFLKLENCTYCKPGEPGHGFNGFIQTNRNNVTYVTGRQSVAEFMSNAAEEVEGIKVQSLEHLTELLERDLDSTEYRYKRGIYGLDISMTEDRRRSSSRNNVINTMREGFPLTISTHSLATRILLDKNGTDVVAHGVEYLKGEEVIISGGAFNTPQLLKLSGVGPREELENFGIEVVVDSPSVGKFLQDHPEGIVRVNATVPWGNDPSENCTMKFDGTDPCFVQWNETGTGYYGEAAAPLSIRQRTRQSENEDIDIWMWGFAGFDIRGFYPGYSHPPPAPNTISMSMLRTQTPGDQAQGAVTLRSADPRDVPDIVFDWFQGEPGDRELTALTESAELLYRILAKSSGPQAPFTRVQPGEGVDIRQNMMDESFGHHASCSCRMGPVGSKDHCVDSQLRVNGVKGLRIVDGSVFPRVPGGFPQAPTYMMALRAADIISPN